MATYRISFQLYSARNFPPLEAQLEALAAIGFDAVEPYRGNFGEDAAGFRRKIDAVGLACPTAHLPVDLLARRPARPSSASPRPSASRRRSCPTSPRISGRRMPRGWTAFAAKLTENAAALAEAGLKLGWHTHAFEYEKLADGTRPIDALIAAKGVYYEPDIGWIARSGSDIRDRTREVPRQDRRLPRQGHRARGRDRGRRLDRRRRRHHRLEGDLAVDRPFGLRPPRPRERQSLRLARLRRPFLQFPLRPHRQQEGLIPWRGAQESASSAAAISRTPTSRSRRCSKASRSSPAPTSKAPLARAKAENYGVAALTVDGLLKNDEIDTVINLTVPERPLRGDPRASSRPASTPIRRSRWRSTRRTRGSSSPRPTSAASNSAARPTPSSAPAGRSPGG